MIDQLGLTAPAPLSITSLLINLVLGGMVSFFLAWHYRKFGQTYSNRAELAQVFPLVALVTVLVISVVKSSLALSLGLVGALSIVRFRTPIKEPEELSYLFMAIAIGLGFGADQRLPTLIAAIFILGILAMRSRLSRKKAKTNLYLNIEFPKRDDGVNNFERIGNIVGNYVLIADMRRLDIRDGMLQATYYFDCEDYTNITALVDDLDKNFPSAAINILDQRGIQGI
jgi:hypothetical protein